MKHIILIKLFILFLFTSIVGKSQNVFFPSLETDSVDVTWYVTHANGLIYQHSATVGQLRDSLSLYYNKEQVDSIVIELMDTISINSQHIDSLWIRVLELPQTVRHIDLSELGWTESGHTGDESTIAAFDETGQPSFIGSDSLLFENDSTWLATRHDLDTLHQKTLDSLLIHRTEIDNLKNQSDSLSTIEPATTLEAQAGNNDIDYITPETSKEQTDLNNVKYYGNKEDVYLNGFKLVADSVIVQSVRSWLDSLLLVGNVHVTDTLSARKLRLTDGYTEGYYLKVNPDGNIIAEAISGALVYQGVWDATTNTPTLTDGTGTNGHFYRVDTQGDSIDVNLGSSDISFFSGDDVIYNGVYWEKMPNLGFVLQVATESVLGGVKKGANVNIASDGTISIDKQTLTAGSNAGQLSISEGNTVTINVNDADHSITNELQDLTWDETTGDLDISLGTGDNLDGRYTLITDWQSNNIIVTNRLSEHSDSLIELYGWNVMQSDSIFDLYVRTAEQSDSLIELYGWNNNQSDSLLQLQSENDIQSDSIQLLSDSLFYYVLNTTFEDSLVQIRGGINSDFTTLSDSLSYFVLTTVFNDSLAIFRQDVSDLQDTVSIHLDTLQSHNLRILALSNSIDQLNLDIYDSLSVHHGRISVNESDIAAIYDSLTNIYTEGQVDVLLNEIRLRNDLQSDSLADHEGRIVTLEAFTESDPIYAADSSYIKSNIRDWLNSIAYGITGTDTTYWNNKVDDVSDIETNIQTLLDSLNYYLLTTDFNDSMIVLRSEIPTLLTQLDSTGFEIKEAQISDLQPYLLESDLQPLKDTIKINSDSIDVLANLINDIETITELADVLESQAGVSDKLMTALRTAEQIELNAVPYYNVREDIYSNFDATFDSIFASNLYQENISVDATGTGGVYDKEVETNNIEVFLNGVLQRENVHYIQTETQITFIMTPLADDYVTIKYKQWKD